MGVIRLIDYPSLDLAASDFFRELLKQNPFPPGHPSDQDFVELANDMAARYGRTVSTAYARLQAASSDEEYEALTLDTVSWLYDLYGEMVAIGSSFGTLPDCLAGLERLTEFYVHATAAATGVRGTPFLKAKIGVRLREREHYWAGKCHEIAALVAKRPEGQIATQTPETAGVSSSRRQLVNSYIDDVKARTERRITRTDFWKAAGYRTRTEFERWQRNDARATRSATRAFERILREKPHLK